MVSNRPCEYVDLIIAYGHVSSLFYASILDVVRSAGGGGCIPSDTSLSHYIYFVTF